MCSSSEELFLIVFSFFKEDFLKMHHMERHSERRGVGWVGGCHERERGFSDAKMYFRLT